MKTVRMNPIFLIMLMIFCIGNADAKLVDFESYSLGEVIDQDYWEGPTGIATVVDISTSPITPILSGSKSLLLGSSYVTRQVRFDVNDSTELSFLLTLDSPGASNQNYVMHLKVQPEGFSTYSVCYFALQGQDSTGGELQVIDESGSQYTGYTYLNTDVLAFRIVFDFVNDTLEMFVSKNGGAEQSVGTYTFIEGGGNPISTDFKEIAIRSRYGGLFDDLEYVPESQVPTVTLQPTSQLVDVNEPAVFAAEGSKVDNYTWYFSDDLFIGSDSQVGTDPNLTISEAKEANEGYYYCELSNTSGSVYTDIVSLMTKRLVARWEFEDNLNDSIGGYNGDRVNPDVYTTGIVGSKALQFDNDVDDSVYVGFQSNLNLPSFTVSAWVKPTSTISAYRSVVSTRKLTGGSAKGFVIYGGTNSGIWSFWTGTGIGAWNKVDGPTIQPNEWALVTATYDESTTNHELRINGSLYSITTGQAVPNDTYGLLIGAMFDNAGTGLLYPFEGLIDDVRYYSYVVDAEEIGHLYADVTGETVCTGPLDYDYDGNCVVDLGDLATFAMSWLNSNLIYPEN